MYGPNYSGFAFHPKTVRMVGSVRFAVFLSFFLPNGRTVELRPAPTAHPPSHSTSSRCAKSPIGAELDSAPPPTTRGTSVTVFPVRHPTLIHCAGQHAPAEPCRARNSRDSVQHAHRHDQPLSRSSQSFRLFVRHLSPAPSRPKATQSPCAQKQKRRVSRETRRRFPANRTDHQAVFLANPRYVSITRGFCANSAAGPSSANSPVSST